MSGAGVSLKGVIRRKRNDLPRFVIIPASRVKGWKLTETTVVETSINGVALKRRSLVQWGGDKWFVSITETDCGKLGVDTGDEIELNLTIAFTALPPELAGLIERDKSAREKWESLTASRRRMLREEVAAAKQPATRKRRARKALLTRVQ